jgi:hypothetical protein
MTLFGFIFTIAIATIIGIFFYYTFKTSGPWGNLWTFLLILILAGLAASTWTTPYGPLIYDFAWLPTFFIVLLLALLLTAATPERRGDINKSPPLDGDPEPSDLEATTAYAVLGAFFYIIIILLIIAIVLGVLAN